MTQNIFKIQADIDVTEENPVKLIPKVDIQSDLIARAAISDFSVIKQAILVNMLLLIIKNIKNKHKKHKIEQIFFIHCFNEK